MRAVLGLFAIVTIAGCATYAERLERRTNESSVNRGDDEVPALPKRVELPDAPTGVTAESVRVERAEPPPGCRRLGFIEGTALAFGASYERSIRDLQRVAARRGGNWVTVDATGMKNLYASTTRGRLYACSASDFGGAATHASATTTSATTTSTTTTSACEPDCSPGYVCLRGSCVEACNPRCAAPARCGADRICHAASDSP